MIIPLESYYGNCKSHHNYVIDLEKGVLRKSNGEELDIVIYENNLIELGKIKFPDKSNLDLAIYFSSIKHELYLYYNGVIFIIKEIDRLNGFKAIYSNELNFYVHCDYSVLCVLRVVGRKCSMQYLELGFDEEEIPDYSIIEGKDMTYFRRLVCFI